MRKSASAWSMGEASSRAVHSDSQQGGKVKPESVYRAIRMCEEVYEREASSQVKYEAAYAAATLAQVAEILERGMSVTPATAVFCRGVFSGVSVQTLHTALAETLADLISNNEFVARSQPPS